MANKNTQRVDFLEKENEKLRKEVAKLRKQVRIGIESTPKKVPLPPKPITPKCENCGNPDISHIKIDRPDAKLTITVCASCKHTTKLKESK